jgi:hypothetical protein
VQDLLQFFLDNPWLAFLVIVGILGQLGGRTAKRTTQQPARPAPDDPDVLLDEPDLSEAWEPEPDPWELPQEAAPDLEAKAELEESDVHRRIRELMTGRAEPVQERPPVVATRKPIERRQLQSEALETLAPLHPTASSGGKPVVAASVRRSPAVGLPGGMGPRLAVQSMLLLGRPRSLVSWEEDPSRGK